ncbi:DUF6049 family protein [Spongiactinospora sp. TRM90649]|uniref:DUF6049 family protein n=1 Tax=Spongiactinospora sp. TRM90649 TaxID=3031114 RepID=UPI0023FA0D26|nr:DUF6049 family protein [Spongiactinospora sp. TRM90649]MDF5756150.1 DUF6049 family protein [Spongiactinospora sp. TRM90649]
MIRKAALLTTVTAALLAVPAVAVQGTAAATAPALTSASAARQEPPLVIESLTPDAPRERDREIKVSGYYTNTTGAPLYGATIRLRYSNQAFTSRAEMQTYADGQIAWRDRASSSNATTVPVIAAGAKQRWEFTVTPAVIEMWKFGVYPLAVEVLQPAVGTLALQRTFVTFTPKDTQVARTRLSVVLPLFDQRPRRSTDQTFLNDDLRAALAQGGRLADLLALVRESARSKGVAWVVDPALLDDVNAMTRAYDVGAGGDRKRRPAEAAAPWLSELRTALAKASVTAAPYADPDVTALTHQGLDGVTRTALTTGAEVAKTLLGRDVPTDLNWPVSGVLDLDALDELAVGGVKTVLLGQDNLPADPTVTTTPDAAATVASVTGPVTALVADRTLSEVLSANVSTPGAALVARQRFLAETAMITAESPQVARTVVAAPYRQWHPDPAFVSTVLSDAAKLPWVAPTAISSIKQAKPPVPRSALTYTDTQRRDELGKGYLATVRRTGRQAQLTADITDADDRHPFERPLLRLASSAWRGKTGEARTAVEQIGDAIGARIDEVEITGTEQPRTLAGDNGVVPISVHNSLDKQVSLRIEVKSTNPRQLEIKDFSQPMKIGAQQNQTVQVPLTSHISGETTVSVQLRTQDGKRYGPPIKLTVRTTGYTGIAMVIVGGALSVMLAAVVLRVLRRRRPGGARRQGQPQAPAERPVESRVEGRVESPAESAAPAGASAGTGTEAAAEAATEHNPPQAEHATGPNPGHRA